jgi:hypothetical protein
MERSNVHKAKDPKEALLEILEKKPQVYKDFVKLTLLCWNGISLTSLFKDLDSKVDRETLLREMQKDEFFRVDNDPKAGSEAMVHLMEKGRDEIIDLFYSNKEKRELKRLFKRIDLQPKKG